MADQKEDDHLRWRRLRADPQLGQKVLNGLEVGVYVTDEQERIIEVNPRAEALLARPKGDFIGKDAHDLLHRREDGRTTPRARCQLLRAFLGGHTMQGGNKWFARGDGTVIPVRWLTAPYETSDGATGVAVLFHERDSQQPESSELTEHASALSDRIDDLLMLSESTAVLTSTLEVDEALHRLVWLVTPRLADWAIVDLFDDNEELQRVTVVHYREGAHTRVSELEGPLPPVVDTSSTPLSRVLRGAPPSRMGPQDYQESPSTGIAAVQRQLFRETGMHSAVIAPLRSLRGTSILGALTLGRVKHRKEFDTTELALVDDIARRAGLAVDNARLYERQRRVAETMQRHLLPELPEIAGLEMVARYQPAPHASQVGGDWYDAFLLPGEVVALVIGDVIGHDLQAAARMSQVRNMLRAFAWDHQKPPSVIVDRLDHAMVNISEAPLATVVFARVEKSLDGAWKLVWTNAGHPPPLLVSHDGRAHFLDAGHGVLLGSGVEHRRTDAVIELPPLTTLVFYTDGLIESPAHSLDEGMAELSKHASALVRRPLGDFCNQLLTRVQPVDNDDDIALIALRVPESTPSAPS